MNETLDHKIGRDNIRRENDFALVVRGTTLKHMLHCDLKSSFLDLVLSCKAVVCCRASPIEKAEIVNLVSVQLHVLIKLRCASCICHRMINITVKSINLILSGEKRMQKDHPGHRRRRE